MPALRKWTAAPVQQQAPMPAQQLACDLQRAQAGLECCRCSLPLERLHQPASQLVLLWCSGSAACCSAYACRYPRSAAGKSWLQVWQRMSAVAQSSSAAPAQLVPTACCVATACLSSRTAGAICGASACCTPAPAQQPQVDMQKAEAGRSCAVVCSSASAEQQVLLAPASGSSAGQTPQQALCKGHSAVLLQLQGSGVAAGLGPASRPSLRIPSLQHASAQLAVSLGCMLQLG